MMERLIRAIESAHFSHNHKEAIAWKAFVLFVRKVKMYILTIRLVRSSVPTVVVTIPPHTRSVPPAKKLDRW